MLHLVHIIFVLLILVMPTAALALEEKKHKTLTELAITEYAICQASFPQALKKISDVEGSIIADASADIDALSLLHVRRSLSRLWNWHFYDASLQDANDPHVAIQPNAFHMNRSLHRTFVERVIRIKQMGDSADEGFFVLSGEIVHFVQDMGVPAHVVPIYHDTYKKDAFDAYALPTGSNIYPKTSTATCQRLMQENESPEVT